MAAGRGETIRDIRHQIYEAWLWESFTLLIDFDYAIADDEEEIAARRTVAIYLCEA